MILTNSWKADPHTGCYRNPIVLATLLTLLPLLPQAEIEAAAGRAIHLDGRLEAEEWSDARTFGESGPVRVHLKRTGRWLALGLAGSGPYAGEMLHLFVSDDAGAWAASITLGIGQPHMPPALWRRAVPETLKDAKLSAECPRGCRARLNLGGDKSWSAEYLIALYSLGIGRADPREFRLLLTVAAPVEKEEASLRVPSDAADVFVPASYAPLVSPDGWGRDEQWDPVSTTISREFDDHELLHRLYTEHVQIAEGGTSEVSVIGAAVQPRREKSIEELRKKLEAGRKRNPTLPAWDHYLARLLNAGNYFTEAGEILAALPGPVRRLDLFAALRAEQHVDTGQWDEAIAICKEYPKSGWTQELYQAALAGKTATESEREARRKDEAKTQPNPRVRIVTTKGTIVCELFEDDAPHAVRNFMDLVSRKFYDRLRFHLVAGGMMAALGNAESRDAGAAGEKPDWKLKMDPPSRPLLRGSLGTIPVEDGAYGGSEFTLGVGAMLRGPQRATAFGRVIEGQEVVDRLEQDDLCERIEVVRKRNHGYDATDDRIR
jgi:peptidyl-prolyl cis-trans isomerase B (cyclophilin B)